MTTEQCNTIAEEADEFAAYDSEMETLLDSIPAPAPCISKPSNTSSHSYHSSRSYYNGDEDEEDEDIKDKRQYDDFDDDEADDWE